MTATKPKPATEPSSLDWCRQRLLVPGHPLALTLRYADVGLRDRLLALHGLISEIAAVPGQVSDSGVARRKLDWWRQALAQDLPHPAIEAWNEADGGQFLSAAEFEPLLAGVAREIEVPRFEQQAELVAHARAVAAPAARLEARLVDPESDDALLAELSVAAGAAYRVRIVRDLVIDAREDRWRVPLDLQAEYQLTRQQVATVNVDENKNGNGNGNGKHRLEALIRHLAADTVLDLQRSLAALPAAAAWRQRHLLLRFELERRLGRRIVRYPSGILRQRLRIAGPMAAVAMWRTARRLRREANRTS